MTMFRLCAAAIALGFFAAAAPGAPISRTTHAYFPLRAITEAGLLAELRLRGPLVGGRHSFARNRMKAHVVTKMRPARSGCAVSGVRMKISFTILMPRALNEKRLPAASRHRWRAFLRHLERHEQRHRTIWLKCARRAEKRMRRLRAPSCLRLKRRSKDVYNKIMDECGRLHDAFDGREKGAVMRMPFIRAALGLGRKRRHAARR